MERDANYAVVGVVSTALLVGLVVFVVWLTGFNLNRSQDLYDIIFEGPVRGLSQGGEVHFNGIKVGEVRAITLDPADSRFVIARVRVTSDVPIRQDSYAVLEPLGITGVNYVQISAGTASKPLLKSTVSLMSVPRLGSRRDAVSDILAGGGTIVQRAADALARVNRVFSDENIATLGGTMRDVHDLTSELRARKSIIGEAEKTLQTADTTLERIGELAKSSQALVDSDGKQAISKLAEVAMEIQAASKALRVAVQALQGPTTQFANQSLPKISAEIDSLHRTTNQLDRLLGELQSSPSGLVTKPAAKEIEVKP